tara:strand:+ start:388 stop:594 length:207 start_codon:yes stop_codon:yes gene_type:complete
MRAEAATTHSNTLKTRMALPARSLHKRGVLAKFVLRAVLSPSEQRGWPTENRPHATYLTRRDLNQENM